MECPHCKTMIIVEEINCGIFRCGIYKLSGLQINPHLVKDECDRIKDEIWGCGKPFRIENNKLIKCDYI
jgi:hypothetical protein